MLDFCSGSGRNAAALRAAGFDVVAVSDGDADRDAALAPEIGAFAATISTHGLLHGTIAAIGARTARIADRLEADGLLYATFGSVRDSRYGCGRRIEAATFAPLDGDERGVAHSYFTRERLDELLQPQYTLERLDEIAADDVAGTWAHRERPLAGAVHWLVIARRR